MIHASSIVIGSLDAEDDVIVGPYCLVGVPCGSARSTSFSDRVCASAGTVIIGARSQLCSHVVVGEQSQIGSDVWCDHHTYIGCCTRIGTATQIMYGARVYDRVTIGDRAWIAGFVCNDAIIEDDAVCLGHLVHRFEGAVEGIPELSPIIRRQAFVGMGALIVGGIEVGSGAYVGAGAVLTRSAEPGRLYLGVPAKNSGPAPRPFRNV